MKASELVGQLMQNILEHGDGDVVSGYSRTEPRAYIDGVDVRTDEDAFGHVQRRTFILYD